MLTNRSFLIRLAVTGALAAASATAGRAQQARLQPPPPEQIAAAARDVLRQHCFDCHGGAKSNAGVKVLDRDLLVVKKKKVLPGKPEESPLFQAIIAQDDGVMPPSSRPRLKPEEVDAIGLWIAAGAPPFPAEPKAQPQQRPAAPAGTTSVEPAFKDDTVRAAPKAVPPREAAPEAVAADPVKEAAPKETPKERVVVEPAPRQPAVQAAPPPADPATVEINVADYVLRKILDDVRKLPADDRPFARYLSFHHLLVRGAPADELQAHRDALAKTINHLSWQAELVRPEPVEGTNTVFRLDLRRLGWDRQPFEVIRNRASAGKSKLTLFDLVLLEYPYATAPDTSPAYDSLLEEFLVPAAQVRPVPYVRADWFISVATLPPLYHDLLQLPRDLKALEKLLQVDADANVASGRARRAGMAVSGVSQHNRAVERHPAAFGAYWKSFDFRSSADEANLFRDPLDLKPAGGEMIFHLPNGLQGYFITDAAGNRLDVAPTDIVVDKFAEDKTVRNGLSCIRCHDNGMKTFTDVVRTSVERMGSNPGFDRQRALQLYAGQAELDKLLQEDNARFTGALKGLFGKVPAREPLQPVTQRFLEAPVPLADASAELGLLGPEELRPVLRTPLFAGMGLGALAAGDVVRRDQWERGYDRVVRRMGLGVPLVPLDAVTRRDQAADPALTIEVKVLDAKTRQAAAVFAPGSEVVIEVTNAADRPLHVELQASGVKERSVLTAAPVVVQPKAKLVFPRQGGIKLKAAQSRLTVTALASDAAFPRGELLRGPDLGDRIVHPFFQPERSNGRLGLSLDGAKLVKKSVDFEVR